MVHKSGHICILQVDEHLISALRCRRSKKGIEVVAFEQERGAWSRDDAGLEDALSAFARRHHILGDDVYAVLPRHEMTVRILVLPSQDSSEIAGMVRLSAEEHVPYPASELVIDQCVFQRMPDGHSRVLAVFAHRDLVESHVRLLQRAGLDPQRVFVSSACLASAMSAAGSDPNERLAVVHLASRGLEMLVMRGQAVEYGRAVSISFDWDRLGESPEAVEELVTEVRATLAGFRREASDDGSVDHLYVCSECTDVHAAAACLAEATALECSPVRCLSSLLGSSAEHLETTPLGMLGAALIAQDRASVVIDLAPPSLIRARTVAQKRRALIALGSIAAGLLVSVGALYGVCVCQRNAYIRALEQGIERIRPTAEDVAMKQRNLAVLQQRVDRSGTALELLARIGELAPDSGMTFTKFTYDSRRGLVIQGRALDLAEVNRFSAALRRAGRSEAPWLAEARQGKSAEVQERGQTVQQFEIEIPFPAVETSAGYAIEESHGE